MKKKIIVLGILMIKFLPISVQAKELSSLKVRGIEEELSTKNNWDLTYVSPRDSMVVEATTSNSSYIVEGTGRIPLQSGANTHMVIVKDASGNEVEKYILNVSFSHSGVTSYSNNTSDIKTDGKIPNPNTGYFINILPLIIFIITTIFILSIKKKKIYKI